MSQQETIQRETDVAETSTLFSPALCALVSSIADLRQMVPPDLRPDRSGILYGNEYSLWLSLNNRGGRSSIDRLEPGALSIRGEYNYDHLGRRGQGTFSYTPSIEGNGGCRVQVVMTGTHTLNLDEKGRYVANPSGRFIEFFLQSGIRIRHRAHSANLVWYPTITLEIQTGDEIRHLMWENRPA